jgi:hypothetical protein
MPSEDFSDNRKLMISKLEKMELGEMSDPVCKSFA